MNWKNFLRYTRIWKDALVRFFGGALLSHVKDMLINCVRWKVLYSEVEIHQEDEDEPFQDAYLAVEVDDLEFFDSLCTQPKTREVLQFTEDQNQLVARLTKNYSQFEAIHSTEKARSEFIEDSRRIFKSLKEVQEAEIKALEVRIEASKAKISAYRGTIEALVGQRDEALKEDVSHRCQQRQLQLMSSLLKIPQVEEDIKELFRSCKDEDILMSEINNLVSNLRQANESLRLDLRRKSENIDQLEDSISELMDILGRSNDEIEELKLKLNSQMNLHSETCETDKLPQSPTGLEQNLSILLEHDQTPDQENWKNETGVTKDRLLGSFNKPTPSIEEAFTTHHGQSMVFPTEEAKSESSLGPNPMLQEISKHLWDSFQTLYENIIAKHEKEIYRVNNEIKAHVENLGESFKGLLQSKLGATNELSTVEQSFMESELRQLKSSVESVQATMGEIKGLISSWRRETSVFIDQKIKTMDFTDTTTTNATMTKTTLELIQSALDDVTTMKSSPQRVEQPSSSGTRLNEFESGDPCPPCETILEKGLALTNYLKQDPNLPQTRLLGLFDETFELEEFWKLIEKVIKDIEDTRLALADKTTRVPSWEERTGKARPRRRLHLRKRKNEPYDRSKRLNKLEEEW